MNPAATGRITAFVSRLQVDGLKIAGVRHGTARSYVSLVRVEDGAAVASTTVELEDEADQEEWIAAVARGAGSLGGALRVDGRVVRVVPVRGEA